MVNIKILDCTLRDGGYVNNWNFGFNNIKKIIKRLSKANVDFIECGYLKSCNTSQDLSIFSNIESLIEIITSEKLLKNYTLMINYGEYQLEYIPKCNQNNIFLRVAFKQEQIKEALEYCKVLKEKGYKVFIHPMHTGAYSKKELINLIKEVNKIKPFGLTIVDTTGSMIEKNVLDIYEIIKNTLNNEIALAFHSHNNLLSSLKNAKLLMKICSDRELIIDTTLKGMGRGAGNLETEKFVKIFNNKYREDILQELIENIIEPIYQKTPWKYSEAYKFSALNFCHPNYATFLIENNISLNNFNKILQSIPMENKLSYDEGMILDLCNKTVIRA